MKKIAKFTRFLDEQFVKSIDKNLKAEFEEVDLSAPYIKKIITREAKVRNQSVQEVTDELQAKLDTALQNYDGANERANSATKKNMIEGILFDYISPSEKVPKIRLKQLKEMIKYIRVSNPAFFKLKDPITGKRVKVSVHVTPAPALAKQPAWMKGVTTAAASAKGELVFNVEFCKNLIQYAYAKGAKPSGGMYESNGGNIPDSYAYIEFLILHEIYHIVHADHFYGAVDLFNLMVKEGPKRWPKLMMSAGWNGEEDTKKGRKTLRRAARRANGQIQNYVGDYITNYELVKKGYEQLPIGLFATDYNYDNFDSMEDIQIAVLDDIEEGTPEKSQKNKLMEQMQDMMDQMDNHLDANNNENGSEEQGEDGGAPSPGGAPDFGPDEDDIAEMSAEEIAKQLEQMSGGGGEPMTQEEMEDAQDIQDALEDRIEELMNDPDVSEEEKQRIQDAIDNQEQSSGSGESGDEEGEEGEEGESGDGEAGEGGEPSDGDQESSGSSSGVSNDTDPDAKPDDSDGEGGKKSAQEKIDDAMKESNNDDESLSAEERDELTPEKVEERIKELEAEAEAEEEDRLEAIEAAKETRKQQRAAQAKAEGELKKPAKPIDWKTLLKKMVPKPIETEEESITKMHRRTKSSLAMAMDDPDNDGVAVKAGIIKDEKNVQKMLFVLDNSGSMAETISGVNPDIMKVIEKSKKLGVEDMYIIKFDSSWDVYKIDLDPKGRKHMFRQFKTNKNMDKQIADKNIDKYLEKTKAPIASLFNDSWGGGTTFPVEMSRMILKLIDGKDGVWNGVLFTDTDILGDGNVSVLQKICLKAKKRPFSFNVILDSRSSYDAVKPKISGYKYVSYLGADDNKVK